MKTFNDLKFTEHPSTFGGAYSEMIFENGYSIVVFGGSYNGYEVEILNPNGVPVKNMIRNADENKINELMEEAQKL